MRAHNWQQPTTDTEAYRRAAGRRRYNKQRQLEALRRQVMALNLFWYHSMKPADIAAHLGVHRTTVSRYLKTLLFLSRGRRLHVKCTHGIRYDYNRGWRAYGYRK